MACLRSAGIENETCYEQLRANALTLDRLLCSTVETPGTYRPLLERRSHCNADSVRRTCSTKGRGFSHKCLISIRDTAAPSSRLKDCFYSPEYKNRTENLSIWQKDTIKARRDSSTGSLLGKKQKGGTRWWKNFWRQLHDYTTSSVTHCHSPNHNKYHFR